MLPVVPTGRLWSFFLPVSAGPTCCVRQPRARARHHAWPRGGSRRDAANLHCTATAQPATQAALAVERRTTRTSAARARAIKRTRSIISGAHIPPSSIPKTIMRQRHARPSSGRIWRRLRWVAWDIHGYRTAVSVVFETMLLTMMIMYFIMAIGPAWHQPQAAPHAHRACEARTPAVAHAAL